MGRVLWKLTGAVLVVEGVVMLAAFVTAVSSYNDDKPSPTTATAFTVFEYASLALLTTVVLAFVLTAISDRHRDEPENPRFPKEVSARRVPRAARAPRGRSGRRGT